VGDLNCYGLSPVRYIYGWFKSWAEERRTLGVLILITKTNDSTILTVPTTRQPLAGKDCSAMLTG